MKALLLAALLISIGLTHAASYGSGTASSGAVSAPTPKAQPTPTPATQFQGGSPAVDNTIQTQGSQAQSRSTQKVGQPAPSSAATPINTTLKSLLDQNIGQQSNDDQSVSREDNRKPPGDDMKTQPNDNNNKDDSGSGESNSGGGNNEDNTVKEDDRRQGPGEDKQVSDGENNKDDDDHSNLLEDLIKRGQLSTATCIQNEEVFYNVMLINTRGCAEGSIHQIKNQTFVCNDGELFGPIGNNVGLIGMDTGPVNLDAGSMDAELKALNARNIEKSQAKEKAFQQSFTQDDVKSWTVEDNTFTMIQTTGCDNNQLRMIGGQRFLCRGNEWLGPLDGEAGISVQNEGEDRFIGQTGVPGALFSVNIIQPFPGSTTLNKLDELTVVKIKNTVENEWGQMKQTMVESNIETFKEIIATLKDSSKGALYAPDKRNFMALESTRQSESEGGPVLRDSVQVLEQASEAIRLAAQSYDDPIEQTKATARADPESIRRKCATC